MPACPKQALNSSQTSTAVSKYEQLAQTAITQDTAGNSTASHATVQTMRDDWDADATSLQAVNQTTWSVLDKQMDAVLQTYAIDHGNIKPSSPTLQERALSILLTDLKASHF